MCDNVLTYTADVELSNGPFRQDGFRQHLDDQVPVVQGVVVKGPVVITLHLDTHMYTQTQVKLKTYLSFMTSVI